MPALARPRSRCATRRRDLPCDHTLPPAAAHAAAAATSAAAAGRRGNGPRSAGGKSSAAPSGGGDKPRAAARARARAAATAEPTGIDPERLRLIGLIAVRCCWWAASACITGAP
jgi:hypothetical protein